MKDVLSWAKLDAYLGTKRDRPLCRNTRAQRRGDACAVRFYCTDVLVFHRDGSVDVDAYDSMTTLARIRRYGGVHVYDHGCAVWTGAQHYRVRPRFTMRDGRPVEGVPLHVDAGDARRRTQAVECACALLPYAVRAGVPGLGTRWRVPLWDEHAHKHKARRCCARPTCEHRRALAAWLYRNMDALRVVALAHGVHFASDTLERLER